MDDTLKSGPSILFFLEGESVPSTRFRVLQYQARLSAAGVRYRNLYTRPNKYLYYPRLIRGSLLMYPWAALCLLSIVVTRLTQILLYSRRYDVIFLQRDLLYRVQVPFLEAFLFWYTADLHASGRQRRIFDIDDAIFLNKRGERAAALTRKIEFIAANCNLILAGNSYLAAFFARSERVVVVPTVVDMARYQGRAERAAPKIILGWTGVSSNLPYLRSLEPMLVAVSRKVAFKLVLVANAGSQSPFSSDAFEVEMRAWSEHEEIAQLQEFAIGLMPLPDSEWARGKCGFKLIQYMAIGIPAVASAIGANISVVQDGADGFLAASQSEWEEKLLRLLQDSGLRAAMSARARHKIAREYSIEAWFPRWLAQVCPGIQGGPQSR